MFIQIVLKLDNEINLRFFPAVASGKSIHFKDRDAKFNNALLMFVLINKLFASRMSEYILLLVSEAP